MPEINVEKLTLWHIATAITFEQAYKIGTFITMLFCGVFWSGYQTSEYFHRQEAYKAQMFEAMAEMWEAANAAKKQKPSGFKLPAPAVVSGMPNVSEQYRYNQAKRKLNRAINAQRAISGDSWKIEKNKDGQPVLKSNEKEFSLPKDEVVIDPISLPAIPLPSPAPSPAAPIALEPIFDGAPDEDMDEAIEPVPVSNSYMPFIIPLLALAFVWAVLIVAARTPPKHGQPQ